MSKKKFLKLEDINKFYFEAGANLETAAKSLGCSVTVLRKCIHEYGLKPKDNTWNRAAFLNARFVQPKKLIPKEVIERVYLNSPVTMEEAIDSLRTSEQVFIRSMRAHGLEPKSKQWNAQSRVSKFPLLNNKELLATELLTKSINMVAREIGATSGAVCYAMKKYGLLDVSQTLSERIKAGLKMRFPDGTKGEIASNWQGGRRLMGKNKKYTGIYMPEHPNATKEGYILEHRLVMEKHIGRYLELGEVVHHRDNNGQNNDISNLELFSSTAEHTRDHFERSHVTEAAELEVARLKKLLSDNGIES